MFRGTDFQMTWSNPSSMCQKNTTLAVEDMTKSDYDELASAGEDGEILELNQVVGYFCHVNRLLNGLGVTTEGDVIGFY